MRPAGGRRLLSFRRSSKVCWMLPSPSTGGPTKVSEVIVNGVYDRLGKLTGEDKEKYKGIPTGFGLLDTYITGLNRRTLS